MYFWYSFGVKKKEFYFTTFLTESEHSFVEGYIQGFCDLAGDVELIYYRKFKNGHEPGYREVKVVGNITKFKKYIKSINLIIDNVNKKILYKGKHIERFLADAFKKMENYEM